MHFKKKKIQDVDESGEMLINLFKSYISFSKKTIGKK